MVAKVNSGKNIRGILNYNENKVKAGKALAIGAENFGCLVNELSFSDKLNRFNKLIARNSKTKTNAIHISLNFHPIERHSDFMLIEIANQYMHRIGFGAQPYLIYKHEDAAHPHIHIVTSNLMSNGKRIDIHNIGRTKSEVARKEIEQIFKLIPATRRKSVFDIPNKFVPESLQYGKAETKKSISNIVRFVSKQYRYTSLHEFNAALRQFNVIADAGKEGTLIHTKKGLQYFLLDSQGKKIGVPIKASSIFTKPTLAFLEKQYALNEALRVRSRDSLRTLLTKTLDTSTSLEDLSKALERFNIKLILRFSVDNRIYGLTFVDNETRCVFNGSDLGKSFSAKSVQEQLQKNFDSRPKKSSPDVEREIAVPAIRETFIVAKSDLSDQFGAALHQRKKRKRKKRSR